MLRESPEQGIPLGPILRDDKRPPGTEWHQEVICPLLPAPAIPTHSIQWSSLGGLYPSPILHPPWAQEDPPDLANSCHCRRRCGNDGCRQIISQKFFSPESRGVSPASHSDRNGAQESRKHQDALRLRQGRHCGEPLGPKTQGQMGVRTSQQMPTRTCDPGKASSYHPTPASALC